MRELAERILSDASGIIVLMLLFGLASFAQWMQKPDVDREIKNNRKEFNNERKRKNNRRA